MNALLLGSNPFYDAYAQSDFLGKCIFLALLFLSIASWVILIQKAKVARTKKRLAYQFAELFEKKRHHPLTLDVQSVPKTEVENPFLEIFQSLKKHTVELLNKKRQALSEPMAESVKVYLSPSDLDYVASHLSTVVSSQVKSLEKHLYLLSTIVTLGPFLGLLGTVWGILTSFTQMSARAGGQSNDAILGGLATALGTTVLGLIVAIPAIVAYNYLKNGNREFQSEMEDFSTLALATVEMQYRRVE